MVGCEPQERAGTAARPHLFSLNLTSSYLRNIKVRNPIAWYVRVLRVYSRFKKVVENLYFLADGVPPPNLYEKDITVQNTFLMANTYPGGRFPFNTQVHCLRKLSD